MRLYLIRHGATGGNMQRRYVGTTDERLHPEGTALLQDKRTVMELPDVRQVYVSPMRRCLETAQILFPGSRYIEVEELKECNFGDFEYHNYEELNGNTAYQKFIDSKGESGFPGGESRNDFQKRCIRGFEKIIWDINYGTDAVIIAHGGTIMSILDSYSYPHRDYYDWQPENGGGFAGDIVFTEEGELLLKNVKRLI